ncbi:NACHT and WD repeat domain-containing protein [Nocardia cyriacigeorgica]|uniref:NACHT and WD repeat domain-containing protein n=1 Tax=Nocardia cyriacigeorgica TaxID=135487 RepID=UPI001486BE76|nr:NACHT and WD repeat domain-containing protein [Nocardia cyriacigeorgica]
MVTGGTTAESRGEIRSPRAIFAQRFADLYAAAGNPTLRRVAAAAQGRMRTARGTTSGAASAQRISDWKAGRNVPARFESLLPVVLTLVELTRKSGQDVAPELRDPREWQRLWQACTSWTPGETDGTTCPYPGLKAYRSADHDRFFGRTRATAELAELVRAGSGVIVLIGASGAGKSSLLAAGLVPALTESGEWSAVTITPGTEPLNRLAAATDTDDGPARLLIVDQFEELFTACADERERESFLTELAATADNASVVIALRADFYARCLDYPVLQDALEHRSHLLGPMRLDELATAIAGPAERAGLKLEPGLEELVITELCGLGDHSSRQSYDPGALPLLSHVMAAAWQHREGQRLTVAGYRKAGGVVGSIADTAEQAWSELSDTEQAAAKQLLLGMVTVGQDSRDTRRITARTELLARVTDTEAADAALELLSRTRLITMDADSVYLTHEVVLSAWPRLRAWIDEDRVGYLVRQRLEADAVEWDTSGRDPSLLYRGTRLETASEQSAGMPLSPPARAFVTAALGARQRSRRRSSATKVALALLWVGLLVVGIAAFAQNRVATQQRNDRDFGAVLAEAQRLRTIDPSLAAQLYLVAHRMRPDDATARSQLLATQNLPLATTIDAHPVGVEQVAYRPTGGLLVSVDFKGATKLWDIADPLNPRPIPHGIDGNTREVDFSRNGNLLATAGTQLRLWNVERPTEPHLITELSIGEGNSVDHVAFHPSGKVLVTTMIDRAVFWSVADPAHPRELLSIPVPNAKTSPQIPRFSPDGRMLAISTAALPDREGVQLWDVTQPEQPTPVGPALPTPSYEATELAFSPDSRTLAIGSGRGSIDADGTDDAKVQLWNVDNPERPGQLGTPIVVGRSSLLTIAFSLDGAVLVTSTLDETRRWNIANPGRPIPLGQTLAIGTTTCRLERSAYTCRPGAGSLAFDPAGEHLADGGRDGKIRIWSLPAADVAALPAWVTSPQFSQDGSRALTTTSNGELRIWDTRDPREPRPIMRRSTGSEAWFVSLSPDGRSVIAPTPDGESLEIIDVSDPARAHTLAPFPIPRHSPTGGQMSPDWRLAIIEDFSGTMQLWDTSDLAHPRALGTPTPIDANMLGKAFNHDNTLLATYAVDGEVWTLTLWNLADPAHPTPFGEPIELAVDGISGFAISPDQRTLIVQDYESIQLWDIGDPTKPALIGDPVTLDGLQYGVLELSPDGRTLAIGSDTSVQLWDISDRAHPTRLGDSITFPDDRARRIRYHPSGKFLAGVGNDGVVRIWDLDPQHAIDRICDEATPMTPELWQRHLPQLPYSPPCE